MREDQRQPENDEVVDEIVQDEPVDEIVTDEIQAEAPADDEFEAEDESESYEDIGEIEGETEMRDMIGYIARVLVDEPDAVEVRSQWSDGRLNINLKVADADKGKVIGRRGRVVHAMQSLLRVAATKSNMRAGIDVE